MRLDNNASNYLKVNLDAICKYILHQKHPECLTNIAEHRQQWTKM